MGGQLTTNNQRQEYFTEQKKEAYAQLYASLRISETNTDTYAEILLMRTRSRSQSLAPSEVDQELTNLYTSWQTDAKDIHKASGDLRIVANPQMVDLAASCTGALGARQTKLLEVIGKFGIDISAANQQLSDYLNGSDSALYGQQCKTYMEAAKKDVGG